MATTKKYNNRSERNDARENAESALESAMSSLASLSMLLEADECNVTEVDELYTAVSGISLRVKKMPC